MPRYKLTIEYDGTPFVGWQIQGVGAPGTVLDDRLTVACREGAVRLLEVQRAGRQPMKAEEFLRGSKVAPGTVLP